MMTGVNPALLFDARYVNASGIGTYTRLILDRLPQWQSDGRTIAVLGELQVPEVEAVRNAGIPVFDIGPVAPAMYSIEEYRRTSQLLELIQPKNYWCPHYPLPRLPSCTTAFATVHDLTQILPRRSGGPSLDRRVYASARIRHTIKRAKAVFAVSEFTAAMLRSRWPKSTIFSTPYALAAPTSDPTFTARTPTIPGCQYLLAVGNGKNHKNLVRMIRAYSTIQTRLASQLVVVVNDEQDPYVWAAKSGVLPNELVRVKLLPKVASHEFRSLFAGATALITPSLTEGVGLPPIEAMHLGVATASSDGGSLRETCGKATRYFNPYSADSIAAAMLALDQDEVLRASLIRRGYAHANERHSQLSPDKPYHLIFD